METIPDYSNNNDVIEPRKQHDPRSSISLRKFIYRPFLPWRFPRSGTARELLTERGSNKREEMCAMGVLRGSGNEEGRLEACGETQM